MVDEDKGDGRYRLAKCVIKLGEKAQYARPMLNSTMIGYKEETGIAAAIQCVYHVTFKLVFYFADDFAYMNQQPHVLDRKLD